MSSETTVLNEIVQEQRAHIAQLVSQVEDLKLQFDLVLNERNEAMDESASAKCVHEALVRNLTSMSEFAGKVLRERDEARRERDEARREVCELRCNPPERFIGLPHELAQVNGWDCWVTKPPYLRTTDDKLSQEAP